VDMNKIKRLLLVKSKYLAIGFGLLVLILILWFFVYKEKEETIKGYQFLIAIDKSWAPLDLHGQEQYMQGFISELIAKIAKEEEIKIQLVTVPSSQLFDNLEKGFYEGVISPLSPNVINEKKYIFSEPVYFVGPVLIVPLHSKATKISELHNVGVKTGFSGIFTISGSPMTQILTYNDMNMALNDLARGKIDGLIMGSVDAYANIQGYYRDKLKVVTSPLTNEGLRLVTLNNFFGQELEKHFDKGLLQTKKEGYYQNLLKKWELVDPEKAYLPPM